ncbi:MAG: hypothetical protein CME62_14020 [Halobacteriovoraceae bacterium]|nr:hypothetical protein [Halobacteriovoraceae bacterium]|tara:strand:+ start:5211 stop:6581 length:1371 start_codon:yes stop_codon:yes gene_type:complete
MKKQLGTLAVASMLTFSCASIEKADLAATSPEGAFSEVKQVRTNALDMQADLLAMETFLEGEDEYKDAREDFKDGEETEEVMEDLAEAKAYYEKAISQAKGAQKSPERILQARRHALDAGAYDKTAIREALYEIDEDLIDETDEFTEFLSVKDFNKFMQEYQEIEVQSVQHKELADVRDRIENAEEKDADDLAERTYARALQDLAVAENAIAQNPRNKMEYTDDVDYAEFSSKLLSDVTDKLTGVAEGASEKVALELVRNDRQLGQLNNRVDSLSGELDTSNSAANLLAATVAAQNEEYSEAQKKIKFQQELDSVVSNYSEDQAEVYQQGDKVILRLKDIGFAVGSAEIPEKSKELLSKIDETIERLNANELTIQGHTDATGSNQLNEKLSQQRADSIASYFKNNGQRNTVNIQTVGLGESRPLASNETEEGRALNRRVDIVINAGQTGTTERLSE